MQPKVNKPRSKSPAPRRALPNKPLPSKPLPNKPIPQSQPPQIDYNIPDQNAAQPQTEPEPQPQPQQTEITVSEPVQASEPAQAETEPIQPSNKNDEKQSIETTETEATNNDWYKPRMGQQSSYKAAKTCKLLLDDKKNKVKKVKLFAEYDKFFVAEGNQQNRGFQVASITNNEYGKAFEKMNISVGWRVTKIGNTALPKKSFPMLKNQLLSMGKKSGDKGYYLMFDGNPPKKEEKVADMDRVNAVIAPVSMGKNSVDLLSSYSDHKVVKIKHSLDKYIEFASVKGPKGYKISGFKDKFGNDLRQYGIEIDWRVIKLGDKDVSNMFTQMVKTNLDVEWRNKKVLTLTFGQPM